MGVSLSKHALAALNLARLSRSRQAAVAIITAMTLPILLGAAGFATDAGYWFAQHAALQAATDAGAMAAARALEINPTTSQAVLENDALAAAMAASGNQFTLTAANFSVSQQANNPRQVVANASTPANLFFSPIAKMGAFHLHALAAAGVAYQNISTLAACQALDSFTYVYSTGLGTLETAHSSGIDPYECGGQPPAPPLPPDTYCNGGVTACLLAGITLPLGLNVTGSLLPVAFQVEPNGSGGTGLGLTLDQVVATLTALLGASTASTAGAPTVFQQGSPLCPNNVCTITAGIYPGGIAIGPGVTFNFAPSALGSKYFLLLNGNLVISTQAVLGNGANPYFFFMLGAAPGAYVQATQVQMNLAPIASGQVDYTSTASFTYSSLLGTQISAPISAMAQAQADATNFGLLGITGLPGTNLLGTNYVTVAAICAQAVSICTAASQMPAASAQTGQYQASILPSLNTVTNSVVTGVGNLLPATQPLTHTVSKILSSSGETSSTTITSGLAIVNGVPTDWTQRETQTGTLDNSPYALNTILSGVGNLVGLPLADILNSLLGPILSTLLGSTGMELANALESLDSAIICTGGCSTFYPGNAAPASASGSGVIAGQTGGNSTACANGAANLYTGGNSITPAFGPVITSLTDDSANASSGATLAVSTTDTISVCGTESRSVPIVQILPSQIMTASTAAGASTLALLQ